MTKQEFPLNQKITIFGKEIEWPDHKRIVFASGDTGSGEAIGPVVAALNKLDKHSWLLYVHANSLDSIKILGLPLATAAPEYDDVLVKFRPQLIVTGISFSGPNQERALWRYGKRTGVTSVLIMDYPGPIGAANILKQVRLKGLPDHICVPNAQTAKLLYAQFGEIPTTIHVTGQPAFDKLAMNRIDFQRRRLKLRSKFGIGPEEPLILFAGQAEGTKETLEILISELNKCSDPPAILPRFHPKRDPNEGNYPVLDTYRGKVIQTGSETSTDFLLPSVTLVVSMYSTVNLSAAHLRIPAISLLTEETARAKYRIEFNGSEPETDVDVGTGAIIGIFNRDKIGPTLGEILTSPEKRAEIAARQGQAYFNDGLNSERILKVILSLL